MRMLKLALFGSLVLTGCPPNASSPTFTSISVALTGPASLPDGGTNSTYTGVVTVTRSAGNTAAITITSPLWLADEDSQDPRFGGGHDLLSLAPGVLTIPANSSTATITWSLGCRGRSVQGTALTLPGGTPNIPDSGEGTANSFGPDSGPADLRVLFEGNWVSGGLFVACICNGAVCP
jgi:hypothetical protein